MTFPIRASCVLVVMVVLAISALGVNSQCTASTCPPGPVEVYFISDDCSGTPNFYTYTSNELDVCTQPNPSDSYIYDTSLPDRVVYAEFNNPHCDRELANVTFQSTVDFYGVCKRRYFPAKRGEAGELLQYNSILTLSNVNATYTAPQNISVNQNYPNFNDYARYQPCYSADNCTLEGINASFWRTQTHNMCQPEISFGTFNVSYDGTCYRVGSYYYNSLQCIDEFTSAIHYYTGDGCQHLYRSEIQRSVCSSTSNLIDHCMAPPIVPPTATNPSATPSSASIIVPSALIVLSIIALLF